MAEAADAEAAPAASARPTPRAIRERTGSATAHSRHQREASVRQVEPPTARDAAASSRLLAEVRQLDATRNALALGRSDDALRELRRYAEEFPRGTLALDAALLEVRALQRSGRRAMAQRRAHQLLSQPGAERHRAELEAMINPLASGYKTRRRDIEEAR